MLPLTGTRISASASGVGTASALVSAGTNLIYFVTDISASTQAVGGTVAVLGGTGSTILWQDYVAPSISYHHSFLTPLRGVEGQAISIYANGSITTYCNISGFSVGHA